MTSRTLTFDSGPHWPSIMLVTRPLPRSASPAKPGTAFEQVSQGHDVHVSTHAANDASDGPYCRRRPMLVKVVPRHQRSE